MKKFYALLIFALSMTQLALAYTYTIKNDFQYRPYFRPNYQAPMTGKTFSVTVVVTGIAPKITKTIAPGATEQFTWDKWNTRGLCLGYIKIDGKTVPLILSPKSFLSWGCGNINLHIVRDGGEYSQKVMVRELK